MSNKLLLPAVFMAAVVLLSSMATVKAETEVTLTEAGLTPDSVFYFLDTWGESISLALTFDEDAKVEKMLNIAEEKLAEANEMADAGNTAAMTGAQTSYQQHIQNAIKFAEQAKNMEQLMQKIQTKTEEHVQIMEAKKENAPEDVKGNYQNLKDATEKERGNAKDAVDRQQGQGGPSTENGRSDGNASSNGNR